MTPSPQVQQKAPQPTGNIPKGRQTYIMLGVAGVIVLAILFTGPSAPVKTASIAAQTAAPKPPTSVEIAGYKRQLADEEMQLRDAQIRAERAREAAQQAGFSTGMQGGIPGQAGPNGLPNYAGQPQPVVPQKSEIELAKEKREYESLFASNVALSYRKSPAGEGAPAHQGGVPKGALPPTPPAVAPPSSQDTREYVLFEGTILEAVLTNRLAGDFTGPVNCMLTTNAYSSDHQHLLLPQGSRILGEAHRVEVRDQQRLAVTFHRLILPDGESIVLDKVQGLDQVGAAGLKDKVNNHYLSLFGTSVALGVLSGFSAYGTGSAFTAGGMDQYRQGVAMQLSQNSSRILDRQLNRLPTITIREGQRVKVYLSADLKLPEYGETQR